MKTKLIALVALAMAAFPFLSADVAEGSEFEADPADAEGLLTAGQARLAEPPLTATTAVPTAPAPAPASPPAPAPAKEKAIKARVLVACAHGQADDLVELPAAIAKTAEREGLIDTDKAAIAFVASLPQNKRN